MEESNFWSKQQHLDYLIALQEELAPLYNVQPDQIAGSNVLKLSRIIGDCIKNYRYHLNNSNKKIHQEVQK